MKSTCIFAAGCAAFALVPGTSAQTLADQKTSAEIAKIQIETEKAKVDMEKARIEADNALFNVLRGASGGSASVSGGEKTAEGVLLSKAALAGASTRIVDALRDAGYPAATTTKPVIVWGSTPPSVAQYILFKEERAKRLAELEAANAAWADTKSTKMAFLPAAAAIATLVATAIPLFKTDTTLAGGTVSFDEHDARAGVAAALAEAKYGAYASLGVADGAALADALLAPLASELKSAQSAYDTEYLPFYAGRATKTAQAKKIKAAGDKLKAAIDAYKTLRDTLLVDSGGTIAASMIDRQRQLYTSPADHPIIYLLNVDAAYTATTKKGLFTGLGGKIPAYGSVSTIIDYAIVGSQGEKRGTAACTIANKPMKDAILLQPATFVSGAVSLCTALPS
ncbi:hypothetical protein ATE68_01390 [Sphingopyxis sp. H038]|uniref:hypothetical protein n=1 Tax=unclassified Sphingopyxis TaxID=2614943 RepID=UPI00072FF90F|nr:MULTISPECIES: hypothetical protein [unclassified Sphingopyxis]KTE04332.1 hypothetical protein ATE78_01390 [Sphingopyxis sp. H012]KTE10827.1 hypothetical protein ATE76_12950 [Sphingopyxis sp. H093]KTE13466.1 hypothetical protein ATE70_02035 [Sphingopyxis sp. H053]KTE25672.1 hypothetical protein ATE75_16340 [Sphingopyxis sp. H080]KTE36822.1 hypothetical protein ATE68_01390 [Sphingopyxis sp. H038]